MTFDHDLCANPLQVCYQATETEDEGDDDDDDYPTASPFFFPSSSFSDGGGAVVGVAAVEGTFPRESMELINTGNMAKINVYNSQSCEYSTMTSFMKECNDVTDYLYSASSFEESLRSAKR